MTVPGRYYRWTPKSPEALYQANPERQYRRVLGTAESAYQAMHPDRAILVIKSNCIYSNDRIYEHCAQAIATGLPVIQKAQWPPFETPIVIVGSGLSAKPLLSHIIRMSKHAPIMALKGAHDWLIENGVTPQFAVACDPQFERHNCFKHLNDTTVYLCASQMHPQTWSYMSGRKVLLWHGKVEKDQNKRAGWENVRLVSGGSTTGMRAIPLAYLMGFRTFELFGYDSCVERDGVYKLDGSTKRDDDKMIDVFVGERMFKTTYALAPQVDQLRGTLAMLPGVRVRAHGDGYFQEVLRTGKRLGWPV